MTWRARETLPTHVSIYLTLILKRMRFSVRLYHISVVSFTTGQTVNEDSLTQMVLTSRLVRLSSQLIAIIHLQETRSSH